VPARVATIEYDPNRTAYIALLHYADGEKRYILAPARLRVGDTVESGPGADIRPGCALPLSSIPTGTVVHNVELAPGRGGQLGRAAGAAIQLVAKDAGRATPRDRRLRRQHRPPEHLDRQGGSLASPGQAPADARHRDEPGRPSAWRRRGLDHRRPPSRDPMGQADARLPHAQEEQALEPLHRARSSARQEGQLQQVMGLPQPPHLWMPLEVSAPRRARPCQWQSIGRGLRPCGTRLSRRQEHVGHERTIT
jgi:hypothetical protein